MQTVRDADGEVERVKKEKTRLVQSWQTAVIHVSKRDEAVSTFESALKAQVQVLSSISRYRSVNSCTIFRTDVGSEGEEGRDFGCGDRDRAVPGDARPSYCRGATGRTSMRIAPGSD